MVAQLIQDSVNSFCSCGFAIISPTIACYDTSSITLRGMSASNQVSYLQEWVSSKPSSLTLQGTQLTVDGSCTVVVQSLNQAGCTASTSTVQSQTSIGTKVGAAVGAVVGCVTVVAVIVGAMIYVLKRQSIIKKINFV